MKTNNTKNRLISSLLCSSLFLQTGCLTSKLYENRGVNYEQRTVDTISTFLIDGRNEHLIIIGEKYHYVFNIDQNQRSLLAILSWKNKRFITTKFNEFTVGSNQSVSGGYTFSLNPEYTSQITSEDMLFLVDQGFSKNNPERKLSLSLNINGTRYGAKSLNLNAQSKLNRPYEIVFTQTVNQTSELEDLGRLIVTPVAIAADGALFIAGVAGAIFLTPIKTLIDFYK